MKPRIRKLAVLVGTTALLGGAVAGCGGSSSSTSTTAQAAPSGQAPQGGPTAAGLSTLAAKLGVSTSALQKAMEAARPTGRPGSASNAPADMAATLAKRLGLTTAKVQAALDAVMPAPPSGTDGARA